MSFFFLLKSIFLYPLFSRVRFRYQFEQTLLYDASSIIHLSSFSSSPLSSFFRSIALMKVHQIVYLFYFLTLVLIHKTYICSKESSSKSLSQSVSPLNQQNIIYSSGVERLREMPKINRNDMTHCFLDRKRIFKTILFLSFVVCI